MPAETHTHRAPLDRDAVVALLRDQLGEILQVDPESISERTSFVAELGADSLALLEVAESMEQELAERTVGLEFDDEDLVDLVTVGDAVDYVLSRLV